VVLEAIARARESGRSRQDAAVVGVSTVAAAVTASTLTTVAVFFPIVFVEGIAGQLFRDQALTVVFALLISLGVALFLIPMLATRTAPSTSEAERASFGHLPRLAATGLFGRIVATILWPLRLLSWFLQGCLTWLASSLLRALLLAVRLSLWIAGVVIWPIAAAFNRAYAALDAVYPRVLAGALGNRGIVVVLALGLLVAAGLRVPALGSEVLPEVHQGELYVDVFLPRDASVERTSEVLAPIEAAVAKLPDVGRTFVASGVDKDELNDSDQGEHSARLLVRMVPNADRTSQEERVRETIRSIMRRTPEVQTYRFSRPSVLSFDAPLVVEVLGHDLQQLRIACQQVVDSLRTVPGLRDVRSTLQRGNPEISIQLDRERLAALDIEPGDVVQTLRAKVQGDVPTRFTERERKVDIRVRVDQRDLATMTELLSLNVNPKGQPLIPLETVASIQQIEGPSEIRRIGNLRGAEVQAALVGLDLGSTQQRVMAALAGLKLPRAIEVRLGSQSEALEQSSRSLTEALLLAIFLVYIVMASQFESLRQPLIIMASLPLAMVGAIFALDALGIALSVVVFLGAIVLAGIVVNNAIILVDQINRVRAGGAAKRDAIIRGAHTRLRPVLMTTMTTVLGLLPLTGWLGQLPLLGGSGEGLELRAPMAITVITGLLSSTVLTLIVVPVIYSLSDRRA